MFEKPKFGSAFKFRLDPDPYVTNTNSKVKTLVNLKFILKLHLKAFFPVMSSILDGSDSGIRHFLSRKAVVKPSAPPNVKV